jgi:hypothetical protein
LAEATPRVQAALAARQGFSPGAVMTEARRLARKAIKAQYQAQGLKFYTTPPRKIAKAVRVYLDTHRVELVSQAVENLCQRSVRLVPQLRTLAEGEERRRKENQQ